MDAYQTVIHQTRYARWLPESGRRETYTETVDRYVTYWKDKFPQLDEKVFEEIRESILNQDVMPSMRALWAAGPALEENNFRGFNCSFIAIDHPRAFDEILFILMAGTGVGFSVEAEAVKKLPIINDHFNETERVISIGDSAYGWATALRKLIADLYLGNIHKWDYSKIRPAGARLKTMGGRASGPDPLKELFEFVTNKFRNAAGRKLTPIECHDIVCKIGEIVIVGGVAK
jgi:ribonucleoside-diphosphate reductase alpha chain